MAPNFEVVFLGEAIDFVSGLETKAKEKIYYNLDKARIVHDPKLFKKLTDEIWEFRILYRGIQYRLFAFWDKRNKQETLVIATHGMIKKVSKVPKSEIVKALSIRAEYFAS